MTRPNQHGAIPGWPPTPGPGTEPKEILLYAAGFAVTVLIALVVRELVILAWEACVDTDAGDRFGATFEVLGWIGLLGTIAFAAVVRRTRRWSRAMRLALGCVAIALVALAVIVILVPESGLDPASRAASGEYPECGPGGVPTWWPSWLPS